MTNIDWQQRLIQGRKRTRNQRICAIVIIAVLLGFGLWHFFFAATPQRTLKQLGSAMERHDSATIARYCQLDSLIGRAYDDLTRDMFAHDNGLSSSTKVMFEKFYMKIKPQVVSASDDLLLQYVQQGQWPDPEGKNILKGRQLGLDYEYLIERSQLRNTQLVSIGEIQQSSNGELATAEIQVRDSYTGTEFTLQLEMRKNGSDWQVTAIKNYRDYLDFLSPIQESGLTAYVSNTKDTIDKYHTIMTTQQVNFKKLSESTDGNLSDSQKQKMADYIHSDIIPALEKRQQELDEVEMSDGAQYLAKLRKLSTENAVNAWQHFATALENDTVNDYNTSQLFHKQALDIDHRIEDLLKNKALNKIESSMP